MEEQKVLTERIVKTILDIEDTKLRVSFTTAIIDECLTKRPYAKHLTLILLEGAVSNTNADLAKLARECLKNLSPEDFVHLHSFSGDSMSDYERRYRDINGSKFENEVAKILQRYAVEGRSLIDTS